MKHKKCFKPLKTLGFWLLWIKWKMWITNKILKLVSEISVLMARGEFFGLLNKHPRLRRNNRIRSVHSSLAIEANSLSVDEVRDVLDNRLVMGPQQEIQEAKNAFAAYDLLPHLSPWKVKDLLRAHWVMTDLLVQESGKYRHGGEGVFVGYFSRFGLFGIFAQVLLSSARTANTLSFLLLATSIQLTVRLNGIMLIPT